MVKTVRHTCNICGNFVTLLLENESRQAYENASMDMKIHDIEHDYHNKWIVSTDG